MEKKEENKREETSEPLENPPSVSEPLRKSLRFTLPKKKLRLKPEAKEVLHLLTIDFLTPKEIASRRQTSIRAVYKVMRKLKQKGLFDSAFNLVNLKQSTEPFSEPLRIRLHGQEWNLKLISKSEKYVQARKKANTMLIDNNTIRLYQESIEVYSGQSFFERDEQEATSVSLAYWQRFFARLEHEFGVILIKPRVQNISLVNQHYGEINSDVAIDALQRREKWKIQTNDDGKIFALIDNSWNLKEMETIHPETAKQDMTKIRKQLNDWRTYDPPTNSQLATHVQGLVQVQEFNAENIRTHFKVLQDIENAITELKNVLKEMKK